MLKYLSCFGLLCSHILRLAVFKQPLLLLCIAKRVITELRASDTTRFSEKQQEKVLRK